MSKEFLVAIAEIVGQDNCMRYAAKFGDLEEVAYTNGITGREALAFYVYTTSLAWHSYINEQLWSSEPASHVLVFAEVLDCAICKLPPFTLRSGLVYRGYRTTDLDEFEQRYAIGSIFVFPGFTSAAFREETAFGGNVLFIIRSLNARAIWFLAADYLEDEVLFPTGCRFRILNVERRAERLVILMQEV